VGSEGAAVMVSELRQQLREAQDEMQKVLLEAQLRRAARSFFAC
jgi:hypothetical protein